MQMFVLVLNREEFLEPLLEEMLKQNTAARPFWNRRA